MKTIINTTVLLIITLMTTNCSSDDSDDPGCFTCQYEKRSTGCNSSIFGSWETESSTIDFELREGLTPAAFCNEAFPANDTECSATCCVDFQFRNVQVGSCL